MTVTEIQSVVASYLQKNVAKFDIPGTGVNLVLLAMNNARKYAEKRHNWNVCRKKGYFSVTTSNKVALDSPTWFEGGSEKLKEGKHWWLRGSNNVVDETVEEDRVLKVIDQGVKYRLEAEKEYGGTWWEERNERQDRTNTVQHPLLMQPYAVSRGKWFELYPKPTETKIVVVDGYKWWDNWTDVAQARWSVVLPTSVYVNRNDDSYLWLNTQKSTVPTWIKQGAIVIDDAFNGTNITTMAAPYGKTLAPNVCLAAAGFTKENVKQHLEMFGFEVELTDTSVKVYFAGEPTTLSLTLYNSNTNTFEISENLIGSLQLEQGLMSLSSYSDWWTENAEEFLILRSLVEANRLGQAFVGNKEGNLPPPVKEAEAALELLIRQDEDMKMAGGAIEIY